MVVGMPIAGDSLYWGYHPWFESLCSSLVGGSPQCPFVHWLYMHISRPYGITSALFGDCVGMCGKPLADEIHKARFTLAGAVFLADSVYNSHIVST